MFISDDSDTVAKPISSLEISCYLICGHWVADMISLIKTYTIFTGQVIDGHDGHTTVKFIERIRIYRKNIWTAASSNGQTRVTLMWSQEKACY